MISPASRLSLAVVPVWFLTSVSGAAAAGPLAPADQSTVTVDASVEHSITPDSVFASLSCEVTASTTEGAVRESLQRKIETFRQAIGRPVRRSGPMSVYPMDGHGLMDGDAPGKPGRLAGNVAFTISGLTRSDAEKLEALLDQEKCTAIYDARVKSASKYVRQYRQELMAQIDESRLLFEEMLGQKLTKVSSMYFATTPDYQGSAYGGPSSLYDPETGTMPVVTSLSITFDIGTGKTAR